MVAAAEEALEPAVDALEDAPAKEPLEEEETGEAAAEDELVW